MERNELVMSWWSNAWHGITGRTEKLAKERAVKAQEEAIQAEKERQKKEQIKKSDKIRAQIRADGRSTQRGNTQGVRAIIKKDDERLG